MRARCGAAGRRRGRRGTPRRRPGRRSPWRAEVFGEGRRVLRVDRGSDKSMRRRQGKRNVSIASLQLAKQQAAQSASSQPVWCIEVTTKFMVPLPSSEYRWLDFLLFMPKKKVTHACKYFFFGTCKYY